MTSNVLMDTRDAACALGVSPPTITRWARDGLLTAAAKAPGCRGAYLFDRAAVEALANERAGATS